MLQKSPARKSKATRNAVNPSTITRRQKAIRQKWTPEQRQERATYERLDQADRQFHAHLRFLELLMAGAGKDG